MNLIDIPECGWLERIERWFRNVDALLALLIYLQIQFCVGTPPGITGRRRSTSGSSCGGSPPPFSVGSPWPLVNSPLRRVGSYFPAAPGASGGSGPLAPIIGSPTKVQLLTNFSETVSIQCGSAGSAAGAFIFTFYSFDFYFYFNKILYSS